MLLLRISSSSEVLSKLGISIHWHRCSACQRFYVVGPVDESEPQCDVGACSTAASLLLQSTECMATELFGMPLADNLSTLIHALPFGC